MGLSCLRAAILGLALIHTTAWAATFALGNPANGSIKSGVGLVSGWVCDAEELEVSFDGGPRQFVPYGSERTDTQSVCGDTDNGFGLLLNYNNLGDGSHAATLYVDGIVATQVNFNVVTLGTKFLRGITGHGTITLSDGKQVNVQWEETTQGFTITGYREEGEPTDATATLEQLLGTWEVTVPIFDVPQTDIFTFDELFTSADGIQYVRGTADFSATREGIDRITTTSLTRDTLDNPTSALAQYTYAMYYAGKGTCFADFFSLTGPDSFAGVSYGGYLFTGQEECDYIDEPPAQITGVRIKP